MKKGLHLFAAVLLSVAALFASCEKDGDSGSETADAPKLVSVSPEDGASGLTGTALSVVFTYDQNIRASSSGKAGISVTGNASIESVNAYGKDLTVNVTGLEEGATYTVSVPAGTVNGFKDNQAAAAAASVSFTMKQYISYDMAPASSLTNANATTRAKALYKFLYDNYGKKTLSGTMACLNGWDNTFVNYLATQTGTYTAICGYDYLFLEWPPKAWSNCPDYGDITDVKAAWDAGSIIQICWHWNVPKSESVYRNHDPGEYAFYTSANKAFRPTDALTDGTWQHECIDGQIAKLAGYMKLLADADIPVLFRPLHEAAGDYSWGPWFWWGLDGADACKQLWRYLYDKLTNTYKLNNLIWVWTVQTSDAGRLAEVEKLEEWYPGEDCVDMVGSDLYVPQWTTQSAAFKRVNDSVKGKKMVALCEIGNLLDIDASYGEGAPWSYFLTWNDADNGNPKLWSGTVNGDGSISYNWNNSVADWKKALGSPYVLNRGNVTNWK